MWRTPGTADYISLPVINQIGMSSCQERKKALKAETFVQQPLIDHFCTCYRVEVAATDFKGPE